MGTGAIAITALDTAAHEATLFAAIWFLVGGIDDLLVDGIYALRWIGLQVIHLASGLTVPACHASVMPSPRIAIFVAAWDESSVIGQMLRTAVARFTYADYRIYVGTYPNDADTIRAVSAVTAVDSRVRLVIGDVPGPTTKAGCLNTIWQAMLHDEAAEGQPFAAVMLHDAEDVVHPQELEVIAGLLGRHAAVQLPVLPLCHPKSRFVSGHYLDEFAEAHAKVLPVRQLVGAGLPLAGVGCAIRRDFIDRIAAERAGAPFDASSLTEDYELGLTIGAMGGRTVLARVPDAEGGMVGVRAYFPASVTAAVRQKARWMTGIALAGWDRTGWGRAHRIGDHWMRMRDRRATLAIPVLMVAYSALVLWGLSFVSHWITARPLPPLSPALAALLGVNVAMLAWRTAVRALFVGHVHGWREGLWSMPRVVVANYIALLAARRALFLYLGMLAGSGPKWEKTAHQFPDEPERATA